MRLRRVEEEFAGRVVVEWRSFLLRPHPDPRRTLEKFRVYTQSWQRAAEDPDGGTFQVWQSDAGPPSHSVPPHLVAKAAARLCGINLIAQIKRACGGDLSKVKRIVKLGGFVQAGPDFFDILKVVNGCSDLMVEVFGDAGRHARSAVGVYRLPLNFAVEVDAVVEVA